MSNSSIRISSGTKKIEVNDNGEYIILPLGSDNFIRDFYKLMKYIQDETEKLKNEIKEDITEDNINGIVTISNSVFGKVEELFGAGTCKKVFGDIEPGLSLFMEFFDSLSPFVEEYQKAQNAKLNKYDARRTGSV